MKIGILGAMLEEISSIKDMMDVTRETTIGDRLYLEGTIQNHDIVLAFSRWGKVASAITATTLINIFKVDSIVFTGVAGAVQEHLNIGDIVIADGLYQHDMDARPFFDQFQIPLTDKLIFKPDQINVNKAKLAVEELFNNIDVTFANENLIEFGVHKPSVYIGLIASGDKFISNSKNDCNLFSSHSQTTIAVEMEGAAVAQVCEDYNIPYLVIRVISDKADHSAAIDFQSFIGKIANKYSSGFIHNYLKTLL